MAAYQKSAFEVVEGPAWMNSDFFNLEAVAPDPGTVPQQELLTMLQYQIQESFKLTFHRETRTMSGYTLLVTDVKKLAIAQEQLPPRRLLLSSRGITAYRGLLSTFVPSLISYLNAPVKDATGLTEPYMIDLDWRTEDVNTQTAQLFAVLPDKGLKLTAEKIAVEVLVIDSAQKPKLQ